MTLDSRIAASDAISKLFALSNEGMAHRSLNDLQEAIEKHERALRICQQEQVCTACFQLFKLVNVETSNSTEFDVDSSIRR
jgi:hypothetical protein